MDGIRSPGTRRGTRRLVSLGPRTPPFHGAAVVNEAMTEQFRQRGWDVRAVDTSASGAGRVTYHPWRALAHLRGCGHLVRARFAAPGSALYVTAAGGAGAWYQAPVVALARALRLRVVVHHHSYAYLARRSASMAALWRLSGPRSRHVALCHDMASRLRALYRPDRHVVVCSNAAFVRADGGRPQRTTRRVALGHLSNLSLDKGLDDVATAFEALVRAGQDVELHLAGPTSDAAAERVVRGLTDGPSGSRVQYHGPLDRHEVPGFLRGLDVFVFPSRYRNEAEPLVVLEALAADVPAVTSSAGCLACGGQGWPWRVENGAGLALALTEVLASVRRPDGGVDRNLLRETARSQRLGFAPADLETVLPDRPRGAAS